MPRSISSSRSLHRLIYATRQCFTADMIPDEEVDSLIRASIRNNRETAVTGLLLAHREFADWHMCARWFSKADDAILDTLVQREVFDPPRLSDRSALRLLKAVRGIQDRTARSALI